VADEKGQNNGGLGVCMSGSDGLRTCWPTNQPPAYCILPKDPQTSATTVIAPVRTCSKSVLLMLEASRLTPRKTNKNETAKTAG